MEAEAGVPLTTPRRPPRDGSDLRRRAEAEARARDLSAPSTEAEALRLVHELQVHQIELELQNAELEEARAAAEQSAQELEQKNTQLRAALDQVRTLKGLLRVCAWCRKVLDEDGEWEDLDAYVAARTDTEFTHGMCPDCQERFATRG